MFTIFYLSSKYFNVLHKQIEIILLFEDESNIIWTNIFLKFFNKNIPYVKGVNLLIPFFKILPVIGQNQYFL